jgi:hypothetical protein
MEQPQLETQDASIRTRLSLENTLMGWIRTTTSLIGFGFTLYQFFDRFQASATTHVAPPAPPRPRGVRDGVHHAEEWFRPLKKACIAGVASPVRSRSNSPMPGSPAR